MYSMKPIGNNCLQLSCSGAKFNSSKYKRSDSVHFFHREISTSINSRDIGIKNTGNHYV